MSGPLDDLLDGGNTTPPPPPPVPSVVPAPTPAPVKGPLDDLLDRTDTATGMRAAHVVAADASKADAVQAAALARRTGVQPAALLGQAAQVAASPEFDVRHFDDIAARHPELAQWLSEPSHAAIGKGDLTALRALSTAAQGLAQPAAPDVPTDPFPILSAFKFGVQRSIDSLNKTLSAGPAWLQQESRSLLGITSSPTPGTPLSIFQSSVDNERHLEQIRATYAPSVVKDLIGQTAGILADPTSSLLLPAAGANLAIKGSLVLGEAALAKQAIAGAAATQAVVTAGQSSVAAAEKQQQDPQNAGNRLAATANIAVQSALAFFFGKIGQEIPVLRGLGQTTFGAAPMRELGSDIVRNAVTGGSQSAAAATSESVFAGQGIPSAGDLTAAYLGGFIPGGLIAAGSVHEAVLASRHMETLRNAESLQFANKMAETVDALNASQAAKASPEEIGRLLDAIADRAAQQGGLSHAYMQSEEWQNHFLAKGMDPVAEAQKAGLQEEYVRARGLGGDMQVPLRVAIGLSAEAANPADFIAKLRPAANAPTAHEAAAFFQAQEQPSTEEMAKAKALAAEQMAAAEGTPEEPATLREQIRAQAIAAGETPERAGALAQIHQRFAARMAAHFGTTAEDIAKQFPLEIQRRLPDAIDQALKSGTLGKILDTLRTAGPENPELMKTREALRGLGIDPLTQTDEEIHAELQTRIGQAQSGKPAAEGAPTLQQGVVPHGTFQPPSLPGGRSLITLLSDANASTVFHESAHYFLEVMGHLADRPDAPQALKDDFQKVMEWSGYGDRAGMVSRSQELAKLQEAVAGREASKEERAQLKALAEPHETFARGFERYLLEGVAPAKGLRRAFAQIKTWMLNVYKDVRGLGVELNPEVRAVFDRILASDREMESARARVSDEPAFRSIEETKFTPEQWGNYQTLLAETHRAEADALEHELMEVVRETQSDAYQSERKDVRLQVEDRVAQERVYSAMRQLQDGETWDGRPLAEPLKIAKDDLERLLTPEERKQLPGPKRERNSGRSISTPEDHGLPADEVAQRLGYTNGLEMLREMMAAPDREAHVEAQTDAAMKLRHPDPMDHQASMDHVADRALHAADLRANLMEVEQQHVALLEAQRRRDEAKAATEAKVGAAVDAEHRTMQGKVDTLKARAAESKADAKLIAQADRLLDSMQKGTTQAALAEMRAQRQTMRVAAQEMIADTKLTGFDPDRFSAAERKAAIRFAEAMKAKDYGEALTQKRAQMMNAELARAAYDAQEQAAKDQKHLRRAAGDRGHRLDIGKAGGWEWTVSYPDGTSQVFDEPDADGKSSQEQARDAATNKGGTYERTSGYLDQIDALLEGFEFKDIAPKEVRRRASLKAFLDRTMFVTLPNGERIPSGEVPNIPQALIDKAGRTTYRDMTVTDLHDLSVAVKSIERMASLKNETIRETLKLRTQNVANELATQLALTSTGVKERKRGRLPILDPLLRGIGNYHAEMQLVPNLVHAMDGMKDGGPLWRAIIRPQGEAVNAELRIKAEGRKQLAEARAEWGKRDDFFRQAIPGINDRFTTLERIQLLMHYGNKEGRQRLLDLHGWNDEAVHRIIGDLDAKDIAFANRLVDILGAHWSDVKAMEERYNGEAPPKVEAIPVELAAGVYKGGYQRIYYDGESATSLEQMAQHAMEEGLTGGGARASVRTPHGATIARVETVKDRKLSLSPGNWARAYNEMAHDLTHRDLVMNQIKLLRNKTFSQAMIAHWGDLTYQQFAHQLMGIAQGNKPASDSIGRIAEYMRVATAYSKRAFNPAYALLQETGLVSARVRVADKYLVRAMAQLWSGPLSIDHMSHWIQEQSVRMKYRSRTRDANFGDALSETTLSGSFRQFMDGAGMLMVVKTWEHLDNVAWKGAYDQHMAESGGDHAKSVAVADQIVEAVMGSNLQKDLPQIMRGHPMTKVFTSQMQWALSNWGLIENAWRQTTTGLKKLGSGGWQQMAHGFGSLATLMLVGPLLWDFTRELLRGDDLKDWESLEGLAGKAWRAPIQEAMSSVPILRELEGPVMEGRRPSAPSGLSWLKGIEGAVAALHSKHYGEATAKALVGGASTFLPIPSAALFQAIDGYRYAERQRSDFIATVWHVMNGAPMKKK